MDLDEEEDIHLTPSTTPDFSAFVLSILFVLLSLDIIEGSYLHPLSNTVPNDQYRIRNKYLHNASIFLDLSSSLSQRREDSRFIESSPLSSAPIHELSVLVFFSLQIDLFFHFSVS